MSLQNVARAGLVSLLFAALAPGLAAQEASSPAPALPTPPGRAADPRPELLRQLDGRWVMQGDVLDKPVTYDLSVQPVLDAAFSELHMRDSHVPSEYEARVFIGVDPDDGTVIAHWLDNSGARYSIPHGTGRIEGETLRFIIPYPEGAFRDTLRRDPHAGTWTFDIEAARPDGSWAHFARYTLRRSAAAAGQP
jgi:hypothetical protein